MNWRKYVGLGKVGLSGELSPHGAYRVILGPAIEDVLQEGDAKYGNIWREHVDEDRTVLENVQHTIEVHAQTRLSMALERLDYGDLEGFVRHAASACGYIANAVLKAIVLTDERGSDA
mgnify:CR=1 FL=1